MKSLLFIAHTPSQNTALLAAHASQACADATQALKLIIKSPEEVKPEDGLKCDGLILGTLENIGYMSGMTKDMFDRCYNDWLDRQAGLPTFIYIRAGHDGTATSNALLTIATGLRWRLIAPPLCLRGDFSPDFPDRLAEQTGGFAAGLEAGIF